MAGIALFLSFYYHSDDDFMLNALFAALIYYVSMQMALEIVEKIKRYNPDDSKVEYVEKRIILD